MKKRILIISAVLGTFILCAAIVMFAARHNKARSALCIQCHVTKSAIEQWKKAKMTIDSHGKIDKRIVFILLTKSSEVF